LYPGAEHRIAATLEMLDQLTDHPKIKREASNTPRQDDFDLNY
jgi:hypothetical protein